MPRNNIDMEIFRIIAEFRRNGDGILARQRMSALHTNLLRSGFMEDARIIRRMMRGMR